jgi:hypothetical protein
MKSVMLPLYLPNDFPLLQKLAPSVPPRRESLKTSFEKEYKFKMNKGGRSVDINIAQWESG